MKAVIPVALRFLIVAIIPYFLGLAVLGHADEKSFVRFAYQDRIGSALSIISVNKGFFLEEGLHIRPMRFSSGPACAEALFSGAADIGEMGDTAAIIITARSNKFVIIASNAAGEHRHRIMVGKESGISTLNDLKGKRIGVKKGTSTYGGLLNALAKANISPTDIDIIDLAPPIMTDALMIGSLDAFAASEPTPSAAQQKGARTLTTFGGLGNEYPLLILANGAILQRQPDVVEKFLRAMKKAERYVANNSEEAMQIITSETGLPLAITQMAMARHQFLLRLDSQIISSLEQTARFLKEQTIISELPDFAIAAKPDLLNTISME